MPRPHDFSEGWSRALIPELARAIPSSGYLAQYIAYGQAVTMAPVEFQLAAGLAQMSTLMGNRITFLLGGHRHPPHLWFVLLGRAGIKKSSAAQLAMGLLDEVTAGRLRLPGRVTPEALFQALGGRPAGYIVLSEFMAFLRAANRGYMEGIKEDLCEIFDSPLVLERKLKSGSTHVSRPAVTIIGASVVDSLAEWVKQGDLAGGFLSRFLFVPQTSTARYIGMVRPEDMMRQQIADGLRHRATLVPSTDAARPLVVQFPDDARKQWEEYDREQLGRDVPAELSGFANRLGLYTAKLALCYALSRGSLTPNEDDVIYAQCFAEYCNQQVEALVADKWQTGRDAAELRRGREAMAALNGAGGWVAKRDLMRRTHMTARNFEAIAVTLIETGEWEQRRVEPGKRGGRPSIEIRRTEG